MSSGAKHAAGMSVTACGDLSSVLVFFCVRRRCRKRQYEPDSDQATDRTRSCRTADLCLRTWPVDRPATSRSLVDFPRLLRSRGMLTGSLGSRELRGALVRAVVS